MRTVEHHDKHVFAGAAKVKWIDIFEIGNSLRERDVKTLIEHWIPSTAGRTMIRRLAVFRWQVFDPVWVRVAASFARATDELERHVIRLLDVRCEEDANVSVLVPCIREWRTAVGEID